jgi:hypothetical protein
MGISLAQDLPSHDPLKTFCLDPNQASGEEIGTQFAGQIINIK